MLTYPANLLDPIEKQRAYILRLGLEPQQCPACHGLICQRSAALAAQDPDEPTPVAPQHSDKRADSDYECNRCGTPLTYCTGLFITDTWFTTTDPLRNPK